MNHRSINQLMDQLMNQRTKEPINLLIVYLLNESSINQSTNGSINEPENQGTNQSIDSLFIE